MAFDKKVVGGIRWLAATRTVSQLFEFIVVTFALMILLTPDDFGKVGMVTIITGLALMLSDMGFSAALIQKEKLEARHLDTVFWVNISTGLILGSALFIAAPYIAIFNKEPDVANIARALSLLFIAVPLNSVQNAWLSRELEFKKISIAELFATIISSVLALTLALLGFGLWALVAKLVSQRFLVVLIIWPLSTYRPAFKFDVKALKELFEFGANLTGFSIVNYFARTVDDLLVGKFFGSASLGFYRQSYEIMLLPIKQISAVVGRVMYPAMAKVEDDNTKLQNMYLDSNAAIATLTFPILGFLFIASDLWVVTTFGKPWIAMIPFVKVFCVVGAIQSIGTTVGWIYQVKDRTDIMLKWGLISSLIFVIGICVGVYLGSAIAVAYVYGFTVLLLIVPQMWIPCRLISLNPMRILFHMLWPATAAAVAALATTQIFPLVLPPKTKLIVSAAVYLATYSILLIIIKPKGLRALKGMFFHNDSK